MGNTIRTFGHDDCFGVIWRGFRTAENLVDAGLYDRISEMFRSLYQLCTEFGWFLTSSTGDSPFGTRITYRYFLETCRAVFGDWMTEDIVYEGVRLTNLHFGADDPRVTNVVFVNAEFDPTRLLSITNYTNTFANAFVIDRAVVALDWMTPTDNDPEAMQRIQQEIEFYINLWVTDGFGPRSD
ncbi:hypothetical protein ZHAS_00006024 [Anopheles sinensis]|uniref:Uncharacterized protein n=1 Tax=Anopheles sinensis TaxID=74873 RepID=A0A084VKZ2_ANOSI|nr:hypothetical protein ZHAS_00006024 [Anopheles sinensis]